MGTLLDEAMQRKFADQGNNIRFFQVGGNDGTFQCPIHQHKMLAKYNLDLGGIYESIFECVGEFETTFIKTIDFIKSYGYDVKKGGKDFVCELS